jgi:uncharacterized membrane protein YjfL (UPF0719 family)
MFCTLAMASFPSFSTLLHQIALALLWLAVGGLGMAVMTMIIDKIFEPKIKFSEELLKGNVAVAIYMAAYILGLAFIAAHAISG